VIPITKPVSQVTTNEIVVFSLRLADKCYSQITSEREGGAIYGVKEHPATEAGAIAAATEMRDYIMKPR
jgi:hypothetical protein